MSLFFVGLRQRLLEPRLSLKLYVAEVDSELLILTSPGPVAVPPCWVPRGLFDRVGSMVGKKAGWQRGQIGGMQKLYLPQPSSHGSLQLHAPTSSHHSSRMGAPTQLTLLQPHGCPCQFTPLQAHGCPCPAHTTPAAPHRHASHTGSDAPPERTVEPLCPRQCPRPTGPLKHQVSMLTQEVRGLMDQLPSPVF